MAAARMEQSECREEHELERSVIVKKNPHLGSSFESWLDQEGIREEVTAAAIKAVLEAREG